MSLTPFLCHTVLPPDLPLGPAVDLLEVKGEAGVVLLDENARSALHGLSADATLLWKCTTRTMVARRVVATETRENRSGVSKVIRTSYFDEKSAKVTIWPKIGRAPASASCPSSLPAASCSPFLMILEDWEDRLGLHCKVVSLHPPHATAHRATGHDMDLAGHQRNQSFG